MPSRKTQEHLEKLYEKYNISEETLKSPPEPKPKRQTILKKKKKMPRAEILYRLNRLIDKGEEFPD
jgi:hypothetical protein